jgi:hypothetical protein
MPKVKSAFIVDDSSETPYHTGVPSHEEALRGGKVAPNKQLSEVVFGPGAFGSPDPATLGYVLLSDGDSQVRPDHVPALDGEDEVDDEGGEVKSADYKKDDLLKIAEDRGVDVDESMTKDEIADAINAEA